MMINFEYLLKALNLSVDDVVVVNGARFRVRKDYLQRIFEYDDYDSDFAYEDIWYLFGKDWRIEE